MSERLDIHFDLTKPQSKAYRSIKPRTDTNLVWGRGCGKSWFKRFVGWNLVSRYDGKRRDRVLAELGWEMPKDVPRGKLESQRGIRIVWLMPTLKQFKDVHGDGIKEELGQWSFLKGKPNWTDWRINFPGGSWMQPFPAVAHNSKSARGLRCDVVLADEADDIEPGVFGSIVRPWFSEPWSLKYRITGGTPRRGRYGLLYQRHKVGRDASQPRYTSIHATYRDNPEIVDAEEVEDARRNTAPAVFAREWEADFDAAEGLVYGGVYDDTLGGFNVAEPPADLVFNQIIVGGDKGWEDPGCLLLGGVYGHGRDAGLWIIDEIYQQHRTPDWWAQQLKGWTEQYPYSLLYHDPSAPDWIATYKRTTGITARDVDNSIDEGVDAVANLFAPRIVDENGRRESRLRIHPRCVNLRRELGLYRRKQDRDDPDLYTDEIVDKHNHSTDALRYMVAGHFGLSKNLRFQ